LIEQRFTDLRWQIPSKMYSDTTLLFPGQQLNLKLLRAKVRRLGYLNSNQPVRRRGDMRWRVKSAHGSIDLYLQPLALAAHARGAFPVRIQISDSRINTIKRLDTGAELALLELAPELLKLFFGAQRIQRRLVAIEQAPRHFIEAVLTAEDKRFLDHHGVDPVGMLRALYSNWISWRWKQGGSTITQQLVKNLFLSREKILRRKLKEMLMALIVDVRYDKQTILEVYLNAIYLGQKGTISINGVGEAAAFYFGKEVAELTLAESATIAGLIKAPNYYSPHRHPERCRRRRDQILQAMYDAGKITNQAKTEHTAAAIQVRNFTEYEQQAPYFVDYLSTQLDRFYAKDVLTGKGITIVTTLDTEIQRAAEKALAEGLRRLEKRKPDLYRKNPLKRLQGAIVVLHPRTGALLALVGGRDYRISQFNRITQAKRQPGSTFKPFVFLAALDSHHAASWLPNRPQKYEIDGTVWQPRNLSMVSKNPISLREALALSVNQATVALAFEIGLHKVVQTTRQLGVTTPLQPYPSIALGSMEVIPLELARAYCAFAADGVLPNIHSLKTIYDAQGATIEQRYMQIQKVTAPGKAFIMNSLLKSVVTDGTAKGLRRYGVVFPVAGKTGTTSGFRDAWFVGYTQDLLALVWVGFDNGDSIQSTGASVALPIWASLMLAIAPQSSGRWFTPPPDVTERSICPVTGLLANGDHCPSPLREFFLIDRTPNEVCKRHGYSLFRQRSQEAIK
jgi:penicillin-binding protein 1B